MFITRQRHEREKQELLGASNRLTDAILKTFPQGTFLLDAKDRIQPQVSKSLGTLFRRQDFTNLSFEKLIGPLVTAKTLSAARNYVTRMLEGAELMEGEAANPLEDVQVRLAGGDGTFETAHYSFEFDPVDLPGEPRVWLVRVSDITAREQQRRELEDLRAQVRTQGRNTARRAAGGRRTLRRLPAENRRLHEGDQRRIEKKPAREADAFRSKLEETLDQVDRVRRDAAALKLTGSKARRDYWRIPCRI